MATTRVRDLRPGDQYKFPHTNVPTVFVRLEEAGDGKVRVVGMHRSQNNLMACVKSPDFEVTLL